VRKPRCCVAPRKRGLFQRPASALLREAEMHQDTSGVALISGRLLGHRRDLCGTGWHAAAYDLVLVARNRPRLEIVSAQIARRSGRKIEVAACRPQ